MEDFLSTLQKHNINVIIDVRSIPHSERFSQYNRENLEKVIQINNLYYRNYALEFGARQDNPLFYNKDGYMDFEKFAKSKQFQLGVQKICHSVEQGYNVVLLCAEKNPIQCHRSILIARAFRERGLEVVHLLPEDKYITQEELERDLIGTFFPDFDQLNMFVSTEKSEREYIEEAYRKQNEKIGYRIVRDPKR